MSTVTARHPLMVALSLRSAHFLSNESVLYRLRLFLRRDGHRGNCVVPQLEALCVRRAGCLNPRGHRLAELPAVTPRGVEGLSVLAPKPVIERSSERPFLVGLHLLARDLGSLWARNELPISLAEPLLGPSASQRRCLARQVGPGGVDDCEPVAASHQSDPKTRELVVKSRPGPDAIVSRGVSYRSTRPPRETLDAPMRLEVARPVALGTTSRSVDAVEPKLLFEDARKRLKCRNGLVGVMDLQRLGMDLVHRHVKMLVLLLAMADRDVLVLSEPRRRHGPANDVLELRWRSGVGPRGETR